MRSNLLIIVPLYYIFQIYNKINTFITGTGGVDTAAEGGTFDISNADRLGFSEVELVQLVVDGVNLLVRMEKELMNKGDITSLIPN